MNDTFSLPELLRLFAELPLTELDYKDASRELHLRKNATETTPIGGIIVGKSPAAEQDPTASPEIESHIVNTKKSIPSASGHQVKSPLVGTFYRSPAPGQAPYAQAGDMVRKGQPLCIVEAMKTMNTIEADADGEIVAILPHDGDVVEYGTPLFELKRA